jgi:hypothetical protein
MTAEEMRKWKQKIDEAYRQGIEDAAQEIEKLDTGGLKGISPYRILGERIRGLRK